MTTDKYDVSDYEGVCTNVWCLSIILVPYTLLALVSAIQLAQLVFKAPRAEEVKSNTPKRLKCTTKLLFHLFIFASSLARAIFFTVLLSVELESAEITFDILSCIPTLLFFASYGLLVRLWAEAYSLSRVGVKLNSYLKRIYRIIYISLIMLAVLSQSVLIALEAAVLMAHSTYALAEGILHGVMYITAALCYSLYGWRLMSLFRWGDNDQTPLIDHSATAATSTTASSTFSAVGSATTTIPSTSSMMASNPTDRNPQTRLTFSSSSSSSSSSHQPTSSSSSSSSSARGTRMRAAAAAAAEAADDAQFRQLCARQRFRIGVVTMMCTVCFALRAGITFFKHTQPHPFDEPMLSIYQMLYYVITENVPAAAILVLMSRPTTSPPPPAAPAAAAGQSTGVVAAAAAASTDNFHHQRSRTTASISSTLARNPPVPPKYYPGGGEQQQHPLSEDLYDTAAPESFGGKGSAYIWGENKSDRFIRAEGHPPTIVVPLDIPSQIPPQTITTAGTSTSDEFQRFCDAFENSSSRASSLHHHHHHHQQQQQHLSYPDQAGQPLPSITVRTLSGSFSPAAASSSSSSSSPSMKRADSRTSFFSSRRVHSAAEEEEKEEEDKEDDSEGEGREGEEPDPQAAAAIEEVRRTDCILTRTTTTSSSSSLFASAASSEKHGSSALGKKTSQQLQQQQQRTSSWASTSAAAASTHRPTLPSSSSSIGGFQGGGGGGTPQSPRENPAVTVFTPPLSEYDSDTTSLRNIWGSRGYRPPFALPDSGGHSSAAYYTSLDVDAVIARTSANVAAEAGDQGLEGYDRFHDLE